ncbi:MAG: chemotaxis protein CheR, partial [Spirochaetales bacterium]|nr:chemotaxis protein CheR [Spirochaetales bacterium]
MYVLEDSEFKFISDEIYKYARINLTEKKRSLIISRLSKRIRKLNLDGFKEYIDYLKYNDEDKNEFQNMINAISTNYSV